MAAAANFAWSNRQLITHQVRQAWEDVLGTGGGLLEILYDVAHNIAKIEEHNIDGKPQKLIIHLTQPLTIFLNNFVIKPHFTVAPQIFYHIPMKS